MPKDETTVKEEAPALPEALIAEPANCSGGLLQLAPIAGVTYNLYQCQTCHQVLHVGFEDSIPTEHSPIIG